MISQRTKSWWKISIYDYVEFSVEVVVAIGDYIEACDRFIQSTVSVVIGISTVQLEENT